MRILTGDLFQIFVCKYFLFPGADMGGILLGKISTTRQLL